VAARVPTPVSGEGEDAYLQAGQWQLSLSYRYQRSDRHFVGSEEEENRKHEDSEVRNLIHIAELFITYAFDERHSATLGVPYFERPARARSGTRGATWSTAPRWTRRA